MPSYIPITDTQIDPDAPLTSQLAYQWRDNPIAIADGAAGAPRIARLALENDGFIKDEGPIITTDWAEFVDIPRVRVIEVMIGFTNSSGLVRSLQIAFSNDNGSSWGTSETILTLTNDGSISISAYLDMDTGTLRGIRGFEVINQTLTVPSGGANAVRFRSSGSSISWSVIGFVKAGRAS
jgi:hypothetical protein